MEEHDKKLTEMDALKVRMALNGTSRYFYYDDAVMESVEGRFSYLHHDIKLLRFAQSTVGVVSDCFILYAIPLLGASTTEAICAFLRILQKKEKDLSIPDMSDHSSALRRIDTLVSCGFVYRTSYISLNTVGSEKLKESHVVLFSVTDEGVSLLNQRLSRRVVPNQWFQAKPISELIGWAACSYAGVVVADHAGSHFLDFQQGYFRTRNIGTVIMPVIVKTDLKRREKPGFIGFAPAFLHKNKPFQREGDYEDCCIQFASSIAQYLHFCDKKKRIGRIVIVVENNDDLVSAAYWLHRAGVLGENYDRVFFTGESILRGTKSLKDRFLSAQDDSDAEGGFIIVPASPDFVWLTQRP